MKNQSIVLASTSPRRVDLMKQVGLDFRVVAPQVDEARLGRESPKRLVARLAKLKAVSVARDLGTGLVVAADTIVVAPNGRDILGKPADVTEAAQMLRSLSGKIHTVLTGYCVLEAGGRGRFVVRVVASRVQMRKLSPAQIQAYIKTGECMDKAGSYAAQGFGAALIEGLRGSYTNVVGLPMAQLLTDLEKKFGISVLSWVEPS